MALSSSNAAKQLSDGNSQGTILGQSSSDKISFYNATPVAKQGTTGTSFASLSMSSGALSSTLAIALNALGLIQCSSVAA
jgi:hypothetical protein